MPALPAYAMPIVFDAVERLAIDFAIRPGIGTTIVTQRIIISPRCLTADAGAVRRAVVVRIGGQRRLEAGDRLVVECAPQQPGSRRRLRRWPSQLSHQCRQVA